jgi:hypothetical protein
MSESGKATGGSFSPSAVMSGIGGLLSGGVAVLGLFAAQPNLVTVVVPVDRLERVVEEARVASGAAAPEPVAVAETAAPAPVQATPPPPAPPVDTMASAKSLQGDLAAAIVSVAAIEDAFLANVRFINNSAAPVQFSGRSASNSLQDGDFVLVDQFGGSCRWRAPDYTYSLGSLAMSFQGDKPNPAYAAQFKTVGPGQSTVVSLKFNKVACDSPLSGDHPATLSGVFLIVEGEVMRSEAVSFEGVPMAKG